MGFLSTRRDPKPELFRRNAHMMMAMLNKFDRKDGEAVVQYLDGNYRVVKPGAFVRCAVTGQQIPLDNLQYWNVELQEAYATPEAVAERIGHKPRQGSA
jgi:hypothetical protein